MDFILDNDPATPDTQIHDSQEEDVLMQEDVQIQDDQVPQLGLIRYVPERGLPPILFPYTGWGYMNIEDIDGLYETKGTPGDIGEPRGERMGYNFWAKGQWIGFAPVEIFDSIDHERDIIYDGPFPNMWYYVPNWGKIHFQDRIKHTAEKDKRRGAVPFNSPSPTRPGLYYDKEGYDSKDQFVLLAGASLFCSERKEDLANTRNGISIPDTFYVFVTYESLHFLLEAYCKNDASKFWPTASEYVYPMLQVLPSMSWTWTPMKPSTYLPPDDVTVFVTDYRNPEKGSDVAHALVPDYKLPRTLLPQYGIPINPGQPQQDTSDYQVPAGHEASSHHLKKPRVEGHGHSKGSSSRHNHHRSSSNSSNETVRPTANDKGKGKATHHSRHSSRH
jgi:hypothetical protein